MEKNKFVFPVVLEKDSDGYFAYCPAFQGCYTQGDSYEETIDNIKDAIWLHIEDYSGEKKIGYERI
ncbi:MAG: type II toxin-antitoxin system HicB family antitoxin [Prochloron sp. SP5CPC1]|nr:type II toxin-antitoxin system HicB family antitoxin [Candidatus Paraprochloron terpiosi SP5CPC1]